MDYKLELIRIPSCVVQRAMHFFVDLVGYTAAHDHAVSDEMRFVQLTPPGSACSICIGLGMTDAAPGSVRGMQMVVADARAAHDDLAARSVEVSDVQSLPWGDFVFFSDPDGNAWAVQEIPDRG